MFALFGTSWVLVLLVTGMGNLLGRNFGQYEWTMEVHVFKCFGASS